LNGHHNCCQEENADDCAKNDRAIHHTYNTRIRSINECTGSNVNCGDMPATNPFPRSLAHTKLTLLVWSASNEKGLERVIDGYKRVYSALIRGDVKRLEQLAYTLAARRSSLSWRTFSIVSSALDAPGNTRSPLAKPVRASYATSLAFVFTGQGAQYADMGLELLRYPTFERALSTINSIFAKLGCEWSLVGKCVFNCLRQLIDFADEMKDQTHIDLPEYSQPLCTALQIALVDLLAEFRIIPSAVIGHSSGEIAAA
jgi:acyl transferase domain-containing protein